MGQEQRMRRHDLCRWAHRDLAQEIEGAGRSTDKHQQNPPPPRFHRTTSSGPASHRYAPTVSTIITSKSVLLAAAVYWFPYSIYSTYAKVESTGRWRPTS